MADIRLYENRFAKEDDSSKIITDLNQLEGRGYDVRVWLNHSKEQVQLMPTKTKHLSDAVRGIMVHYGSKVRTIGLSEVRGINDADTELILEAGVGIH